jgi:hypothetical protein
MMGIYLPFASEGQCDTTSTTCGPSLPLDVVAATWTETDAYFE